ncbi:MAG TPA: S41 family peptidase [Pyrinomonadaceae bacterium]|nr:S41 family peptidase [Pyrinomonadaceae bacterium]
MSRILKLVLNALLCAAPLSPCLAAPRAEGESAAFNFAQRGKKKASRARASKARASRARAEAARRRRAETFQVVWQTVKDEHFDPTFGGVDWDAVRVRYAPLAARTKTDAELHLLLQVMLNELGQSHFNIVPPENIPRFDARRWGAERADAEGEGAEEAAGEEPVEEDEEVGSEELSVRMMNGVGVDVRVLAGRLVITRVEPGGPAARAGLRPGFVIKTVDEDPVEEYVQLATEGENVPPLTLVRIREEILLDYLGGEPGTEVRIGYVDEKNREREAIVKRERLRGELSPPFGNLPPIYTELETKRLAGEVGYVRLSAFAPQLMERLCAALRSLGTARGIVLDLRGNPGGVMGLASGLAGLLTTSPGVLGTMRTRTGVVALPSFPQRSPYTGPLVVLIDGLSGSTAEVLAAALQESGRAEVVGERSAGMVLGADTRRLPTGALLLYARAGFITSDGVALEGRGVVPDVEKKLDREALLRGRDEQLEEAVRRIQLSKSSAAGSANATPPPPPAPLALAAPPPAKEVAAPVVVTAAQATGEGNGGGAAHAPKFVSTPEAERVMERHLQAVGGRQALASLKSRVSRGTSTLPMQSMTGKVVIYEQAPDKRSMELNVQHMGVMQFAYDGARGWMQHPLMGLLEYNELLLPGVRRDADFHKLVNYREQYTRMEHAGTRGNLDVLRLTTPEGTIEEMHFDRTTGLLAYHGGMYFDDYRQVGAVKVPFSIRLSFSGLEMNIRLEHVAHDVAIEPSAFAETQNCFTKR